MSGTKDAMQRIEEFKAIMVDAIEPAQMGYIIQRLAHMDFFTMPASAKYHGAYFGGLFDHSKAVTEQLVKLTDKLGLQWAKPRSPYIIGMFHDLCKCDAYIAADGITDKPSFMFNKDVWLDGHGSKSVILAQTLISDLTLEEIACIRWHMGAFDDKENWNYYNKAITLYPNVLYTHTADMIASKIVGI